MPVPATTIQAFDERSFLLDLQRLLQESGDFTLVDDSQIVILDRDPEGGADLTSLNPPAVVLMPGAYRVEHGFGGVGRCAFPVMFLAIGETLDAQEDSDRYTDETEGSGTLRTKLENLLYTLGPDGAFTLTQDATINYVEPGDHEAPVRVVYEDGTDLSVLPLTMVYDVEWLPR